MRLIEFVQTALIVIAVVSGIQAVGVVLMAAMLITPAASARYWTDSLPVMILIAVVSGVVAAVAGVGISTMATENPDRAYDCPCGNGAFCNFLCGCSAARRACACFPA